jgi:hypothetical protein
MLAPDTKSIASLFGDVFEQLGSLVGTEARLAQAEISEKIEEASLGVAYAAAAAVLIIPALVMLLLALALWFTQMGVAPVLSYLGAAAIGGLLSVVLGFIGLNRLNPKRLKLSKTKLQIDLDIAAARKLAK